MNNDRLAFPVMLRGLQHQQAFKREKQQLRRAQRKAAERNKSAAQDADYLRSLGALDSTSCAVQVAELRFSPGVCFRLWMSDVRHAVCCRKRRPCW